MTTIKRLLLLVMLNVSCAPGATESRGIEEARLRLRIRGIENHLEMQRDQLHALIGIKNGKLYGTPILDDASAQTPQRCSRQIAKAV